MALQYVLPRTVAAQLGRLRVKLKQVVILRGIGLFLMITAVSLVGMMLADWWFDLEPRTRMGLLTLFGLEVLALGAWFIARPVFRKIDDVELAAFAEQKFPELGERLVTLIEIGDESVPEAQRGSPLMREMLEFQTIKRVESFDFEQAVSTGPALRSFAIGISLVALFMLSLLLFPSVTGTLFVRLANPWGNYESVSLLNFHVIDGERVLARGSDVAIAAKVEWKNGSEESIPEPVTVEIRSASGDSETRELRFDPDTAAFTTTVPKVFESFEFIVTAADSRSKRYQITVVEAPVVTAAKLEITPPGYVGEPRRVVDGIAGEISVFEGSQLRFDLTFNKPMKSAEISWLSPLVVRGSSHDLASKDEKLAAARRVGDVTNELVSVKTLPATPLKVSADGLHATLEMSAEVQANIEFRLRDEFGLGNTEPLRNLLVTLDQPPHLDMPGAQRDEARPTDVFPVTVDATDDFGIGALELHVTSDKGLKHMVAVEREKLGSTSLTHEFRVDLSDLAVKAGDILTVQVRAADERPQPEANEVWSQERVIALKVDASAPGAKEVLARQDEIRKELAAIQQELAKKAQQATTLQETAQKAADGNQPLEDREPIEALADAEIAAAEQLKNLAARFGEHPLFANLAPEAQQLAEKNVEAAANNLELAATEKPAELAKELKENAETLKAASDRLGEMRKRFDELAKLERDLLDVTRLAQRANQLADDASKLEERRQELADQQKLAGDAPEAQQALREELAREQQQLQQEQEQLLAGLNDLFEKRPELLQAARDHQLDQLADLAEQLRDLAEPQEQLAKAVEEKAQQAAADAQPLAAKQQDLAKQAEQLAARTDQQQARQPVAPLDPERARQIAEELKQGNIEAAERLAKEAAQDLERLAKDLLANNPLPDEPKAAATELARRQRELADQIDQARAAAAKPSPPADPQGQPPGDQSQNNPAPSTAPKPGDQQPAAAADARPLAARQAALEMAAAQLNLDRDSRDEQQAAVNRAADAVQELIAAGRAAERGTQQPSNQQPSNQQPDKQPPPMPPNNGVDPAAANPGAAPETPRPDSNKPADAAKTEQLQRLDRAAADAREAAAALDRLAEVAQTNPDAATAPQPAARNAQEAAQKLSQQQRELREQTEKLDAAAAAAAANPTAPMEQNSPPNPQQQAAANQQQALREQAEQLPNDVASLPRAEAIDRLAAAEQALEEGRLNDASKAQREAEAALDQFARQAGARADQPPATPEANGPQQLAEQAQQLAAEQRELAAELAQMGQPPEPRAAGEPNDARAQNSPPGERSQPQPGTEPTAPSGQPQQGQPQPGEQAGPPQSAPTDRSPQATRPSANQLAERQEDLTAQAAELAIQAAEQAGAESSGAREARRSVERGEQAENSTRNGQFARASDAAEQAGEAAQQAAESLRPSAPNLADRAAQIAQQQQQLAQDLDQLGSDPAAQAAAQREQQQALAQRADALQQALGELSEQLGAAPINLNQPSQRANQAGQTTDQSRQSMQQANAGLNDGNPGDAAQSGRQAAEGLRQAAEQAAAMQRPQSTPNNPIPGEFANDLAQAAQRLQQAQQQLTNAMQAQAGQPANGRSPSPPSGQANAGQPPTSSGQPNQSQDTQPGPNENGQPSNNPSTPAAAQNGQPTPGQNGQAQGQGQAAPGSSLSATADSLRQAASNLNQVANQLQSNATQPNNEQSGPGQPNQQAQANGLPSSGSGAGSAGPGGEIKAPDASLQKHAMRNWGKLPGTLKTEILQSSQRKANGDYAKLIKLYFEELAKSGEKPEAK